MKKSKTIIISIIIITSILLFGKIYTNINTNTNISNKKLSTEELNEYKFIRIKYLVMKKTNDNYSLYDALPDHFDDYLSFATEYMLLEKGNNYYTVNLKSQANKKVLDSITDYVFAMNNNDAQMLEDCIFDKENLEIKIPSNYFEQNYKNIIKKNSPVQVEFLARMSEENIKNLDIKVKNKNITSKTKKIERNGKKYSFSITGLKNHSKNDIKIYMNDAKVALSKQTYDYNKKTGKIEFDFSPVLVNNIEIKYENKISSLLNNVIFGDKASAAAIIPSEEDRKPIYELSSKPSCLNSSCGGTATLHVYRIADYPGDYILEAQVPNNQFGSGYADVAWQQLSDNDFWSKNNTVNDVLVINPKTAFNFEHDDTKFIGTSCLHISKPMYYSDGETKIPESVSYNDIATNVAHDIYNYSDPKGADLPFLWKVSDGPEKKSDGYSYITVVAMLDYYQYYFSGVGTDNTDTDPVKQTLVAILKFKYKDNAGYIQINKEFDDGTSPAVEFTLYDTGENRTCGNTEIAKSKRVPGQNTYTLGVDDSNNGTLEVGKSYCVKETSNNGYLVRYKQEGNILRGSDYAYVTITEDSNTNGNFKYEIVNVKNYSKKYCLKVKKVDAEKDSNNNDIPLSEVTFRLNDNSSTDKSTNGNGEIIYCDLDYSNYKVTEITAKDGYWNDDVNATEATIKASDLTEMTATLNTTTQEYEFSQPSTINASSTYTKKDHKKYYCIKVKKIDPNTNTAIPGASFKTTINGSSQEHADNWDGSNDGYTTFFTDQYDGTYNVTETKAPEGYAVYTGILKAKTKLMSKGKTKSEAETECKNADPSTFESDDIPTAPNRKKILNFYKTLEDGTTTTGAEGAKFEIKDPDGNKIYHKMTKDDDFKDDQGTKKSCYEYSATSTGTNSDVFESDANGEVCVTGMPKDKYNVIETKAIKYHTFGPYVDRKNIPTSTTFAPMGSTNKFINYKTTFEFTKTVSSGDDDLWKNITTEELKKIEFNVFDSNNNIVSVIPIGEGKYSYAGNDIDRPSGTPTTALFLDSNRKIYIEHLPVGTYTIKEKANASGTCDCTTDANCIGFYTPTYNQASDYTFTITECSNASASTSACSSPSASTQNLENIPTEIKFTKKDFYSYEDASDVVDFENDKERNDFDRIDFQLKDANGNPLRVVKVGNHITDANNACLNDADYAEYRYVPNNISTSQLTSMGLEVIENGVMHTCGGHIRITHLCRGKKFYIEEVSVPENSVFTLPENEADRLREYNIPCCGDTTTTSITQIISDKPTRVRFEKRDSKYGYLIPDETTTFQVYQCKKGTTCHPSDGITSDMKLMKFSERAVINNDEEDPTDVEGLEGVEVYKAMSDSDVQKGGHYVTDLHPYHGILVFRYLPSGYNYVLLETVAPKNYNLPIGRDRETSFTVRNDTVSVEEVDVPNVATSLLIRKYSDDGKLLSGAQFKIYEGTTCDSKLSAMNQPKTELKLKTIRDGVYESRPETDTEIIQTCTDKEGYRCSDIPVNVTTKLTYTKYLGTYADFENVINENNEKITLKQGEALVQYLEYNHCYIIEEVKAPEGYSLPKNEEDRYTMITIEENEQYAQDTYKTLVNTPTPFTFYKFDEYNNLLDGAEFKLQKLDNDKKYQDITVTKEEKNEELFYKADKESTNTTIETRGGKATVYYLTAGQYRIVETKAAPGKELTKNPNIATFFVDDSGNVYGNSIIVNKEKTSKIEITNSSQAEFILGPQTGQIVIKYGLIIAILVGIITGLMILRKKTK